MLSEQPSSPTDRQALQSEAIAYLLNAAYDALTDFIYIVDADYRVVHANQAVAQALNTRPEEMVGKHCYELMHDGAAPPPFCPLRDSGATDPVVAPRLYYEPKFNAHLEIRATRVFREGKLLGIVAVARDVTEREEQYRRTRQILELAPAAVCLTDGEGRITFANERAATLFSQDPEQLTGQAIDGYAWSSLHPGRQEPDEEAGARPPDRKGPYARLLESVEPLVGEYMECRTSKQRTQQLAVHGALLPCLREGSRTSSAFQNGCAVFMFEDISSRLATELFLRRARKELEQEVARQTAELRAANTSLALEITEREEAERALAKSEERYRTLFEGTRSVMLIVSPDDGRILGSNPAARAFYGYGEEEFAHLTIANLSTEPPEKLRSLLRDVASGNLRSFTTRHKLASGEIRYVTVFSSQIRLPEREALFSVIHDVTAQKKAEEELISAQAAMAEAAQAKNRFLASMTHELRTPLHAIHGMAELLAEEVTAPEQAETVMVILEAARSLSDLVTTILDFASAESGRLGQTNVPFNLPSLLAGIVAGLGKTAAERGVELALTPGEDLPETVLADGGRLRLALDHLLRSCVKASSGGQVRLLADLAPPEEATTPGDAPSSSRPPQVQESPREWESVFTADGPPILVRFRVETPASSLTQAELTQALCSFHPAPEARGEACGSDPNIPGKLPGTGLGLAVAHKIIDLMGATLRAHSLPEGGHVLTFTLAVQPVRQLEEGADVRDEV